VRHCLQELRKPKIEMEGTRQNEAPSSGQLTEPRHARDYDVQREGGTILGVAVQNLSLMILGE
jgi:hypothetical protein